jgi:hypothetical protein
MLEWGGQSLVESFIDALFGPVQDWLVQHPLWLWLFTHPLWLLGAILLALFLLAGLLRAIAGLTEQLWLGLLRLPILLVQTLWQGGLFLWRLVGQPANQLTAKSLVQPTTQLTLPAAQPTAKSDRLTEIVDRLEALRQEQDELLKEVKLLLNKQSSER